jgi:hypothetical protein
MWPQHDGCRRRDNVLDSLRLQSPEYVLLDRINFAFILEVQQKPIVQRTSHNVNYGIF